MSRAVECPTCHATEHARRHTLYRTEPAPWWMRLLNRCGATLPTMIERACGYYVTCQRGNCLQSFCIGDGGPRDVWRMVPLEAAARQNHTKPETPEAERPVRDPADGLGFRLRER